MVKSDVAPYSGDAQMQRRVTDYALIIGNFVSRMFHNYGDDSWRQWFQTNVRIEPMNEVNGNLSGQPAMAASLDSQVKSNLAADGVSVKRVVASSIVSGGNYDYLGWYWNTTGYDGYYQKGGPTDATPNIHLYYVASLDNGSFANSIASCADFFLPSA